MARIHRFDPFGSSFARSIPRAGIRPTPGGTGVIMSGIRRIAATAVCLTVWTVIGRSVERTLVFSSIDFPGATLTNAQGVNAGGEIVGFYNDAGTPSRTHGFLLSGGQYRTIEFPGA